MLVKMYYGKEISLDWHYSHAVILIENCLQETRGQVEMIGHKVGESGAGKRQVIIIFESAWVYHLLFFTHSARFLPESYCW